MKILKIIGLILALLVVIFLAGGLFLPKSYSVTRTTVINAPDSIIYRNIANFNAFHKWNPWAKMDPESKITVSGPIAQPEHLYEWVGEKTGSGQMKILTVIPNQQVAIELKFFKPFESLAATNFKLTPTNGQTTVSWTMSGKNEGIFDKWMSLMMDNMIGKDFENGLNDLKKKSEQEK